MMLCRGYKSSEITIIAAYKGQKKQIIKELINLIDQYYNDEEMSCYDAFDFENDLKNNIYVSSSKIDIRNDFKTLIEIRKKLVWNFVKCLDDFQGEENEVIILSLTRSSEIGFLRERNRSLVALSRAKQMEIVVGNKSIFGSESEKSLWQRISSQLNYVNRNRSQNGITIEACQIHEKQLYKYQVINSLDDLLKYRFNHCTRYCNYFHDCNHQCQLPCHYHKTMRGNAKFLFDRRYYCPYPCQLKCKKGHQCQGICGECTHFGCLECLDCQHDSDS